MAAMAVKPDFPPLLAPGFHRLDLDGICRLCCFPDNLRRRHLFLHLERLVQDLLIHRIPCEIWINGRFLTTKDGPSDLDVIIKFDYDVTCNFTPTQKEFMDNLEQEMHNERIDSWVSTVIPRGHQEFTVGENDPSDRARLYSVEHSGNWLKGIAVLRLGENDVELRFCP